MSMADHMHVCLRLPTQLLHAGDAHTLYAVAEDGAFTLLPNHADYVAVLIPSVLVLTGDKGEELFFGIDHGLLVKHGHQVDVSVRRAVRGDDLATLGETIRTAFEDADEAERSARTALSRLEIGIVRQFSELRKPRT